MPTERNRLNPIRAVWHAYLGHDADYFPRFIGPDGKEKTIGTDDLIRRVASELGSIGPSLNDQIESMIKCGRESLDEVKELTEYQDQKATRNLTIITFLSALAGVLFSRFADIYPFRGILEEYGAGSWEGGLVMAGYGLFLAFVGCAVSGALVVFHATQVRFKYPQLVEDRPHGPLNSTKSFIFFQEIIRVTPEEWALSFFEENASESTRDFKKDLRLEYIRNYIIETYLIAAKVADKLRYLMPAQTILSFSIKILLLWLIIATAAVIVVPEQSKNAGALNQPATTSPVSRP